MLNYPYLWGQAAVFLTGLKKLFTPGNPDMEPLTRQWEQLSLDTLQHKTILKVDTLQHKTILKIRHPPAKDLG